MSNRNLFLLGATVGGTAGGFLPMLWGDSGMSGTAILTSTIGGFAGLWLAYKFRS